jgi:molybdate transport system substrate-binding protein
MKSLCALVVLLACASLQVRAEEVAALVSGAVRPALERLVPGFESTTGIRTRITWSGAVDTNRRMQSGEVFDIVIGTDRAIDSFITRGLMAGGSRRDLVKSGIGVAVKAGAPRPDIASVDALKKTLLAASSIGYSTGPSGVYLLSLFERLGIADALKPRLRTTVSGTPVGELVARGEVEIGFQQISELLPVQGIAYLGPLPADAQNMTVFAAGTHVKVVNADSARAFIRFLSSPAAADAYRSAGLEPVH